MKQGNFAAWITANTAAWILAQAVGRLNRRKEWSQATNVCFCISTLHAMCSVASSTATEANTIFFYTPYSKRLHGFISKLGFRVYCVSDYRVSMLLLSEVFYGKKVIAWIPHASPLGFSPFVRRLILTLDSLLSVKYIDDGMGFISRNTLVYRMGYIRRDEQIHSWNFLSSPTKAGFPATVSRSQFQRALEVIRSHNPSLISQGMKRIRGLSASKAGCPVNLILGSKLLDADLCFRHVEQNDPRRQTYYVPHYNVTKNYPVIALRFPSVDLEMPEFGLLGIAEAVSCRIYFGVTISIVFLIELLLRNDSSRAVEFVFVGERCCQGPHGEELIDFRRLLNHYQAQKALRDKGINILIL